MKYSLLLLSMFSLTKLTAQDLTKTFYNDKMQIVSETSNPTYYQTAKISGKKKIHPINLYYTTGELYIESKPDAYEENGKSTGCFIIYSKTGQTETEQCFEKDKLVTPIVKAEPKVKESTFFGDPCKKCDYPINNSTKQIEFSLSIPQKGKQNDLYIKAYYAIMASIDQRIGSQVDKLIIVDEKSKEVSRMFAFDVSYGSSAVNTNAIDAYQIRGIIFFTLSIKSSDNQFEIRATDFKFQSTSDNSTPIPFEIWETTIPEISALSKLNQKEVRNRVFTLINGAYGGKEDKLGYLEMAQTKLLSFLSVAQTKIPENEAKFTIAQKGTEREKAIMAMQDQFNIDKEKIKLANQSVYSKVAEQNKKNEEAINKKNQEQSNTTPSAPSAGVLSGNSFVGTWIGKSGKHKLIIKHITGNSYDIKHIENESGLAGQTDPMGSATFKNGKLVMDDGWGSILFAEGKLYCDGIYYTKQ